ITPWGLMAMNAVGAASNTCSKRSSDFTAGASATGARAARVTGVRRLRAMRDLERVFFLPSPLRGGVGGGGLRPRSPPLPPAPSPKRGGGSSGRIVLTQVKRAGRVEHQ